jgi:hypothetical protein
VRRKTSALGRRFLARLEEAGWAKIEATLPACIDEPLAHGPATIAVAGVRGMPSALQPHDEMLQIVLMSGNSRIQRRMALLAKIKVALLAAEESHAQRDGAAAPALE